MVNDGNGLVTGVILLWDGVSCGRDWSGSLPQHKNNFCLLADADRGSTRTITTKIFLCKATTNVKPARPPKKNLSCNTLIIYV